MAVSGKCSRPRSGGCLRVKCFPVLKQSETLPTQRHQGRKNPTGKGSADRRDPYRGRPQTALTGRSLRLSRLNGSGHDFLDLVEHPINFVVGHHIGRHEVNDVAIRSNQQVTLQEHCGHARSDVGKISLAARV